MHPQKETKLSFTNTIFLEQCFNLIHLDEKVLLYNLVSFKGVFCWSDPGRGEGVGHSGGRQELWQGQGKCSFI